MKMLTEATEEAAKLRRLYRAARWFRDCATQAPLVGNFFKKPLSKEATEFLEADNDLSEALDSIDEEIDVELREEVGR